MGKLTIEFDILGMTKPQRGNADLGCYLGDVVAVALYYLGEVRKENAGSDSQASAPPSLVVDRNGHRWNDAPDGGEDMALEALKVALSVEFSQVRTKRFEVPLPQPPHHRPPTTLILCPTQGPRFRTVSCIHETWGIAAQEYSRWSTRLPCI